MVEKEKKGCLLLIGIVVLASIGIFIGLEFECPYLKNLCIMLPGCAGAFVGSSYFSNKKNKMTTGKWALFVFGLLLLTALLTWLMEDVFK